MGEKVIVVVWEFPPGPGGIGQHAFTFSKELHNRNIEVVVVTTADYANLKDIQGFDLLNSGLKIIRVSQRIPILKQFVRIISVIRKIKSFHPTRVYLSGKGALWLMPWIRGFVKNDFQISIFLHGSEIRLANKLARTYTNFCIRKADFIFPVSGFTRSILPEDIRDSQNIKVVPNGINLKELSNCENGKPNKLKGSPSLLTVGNLTRRKGQFNVLEALPVLSECWPQIHYHVVGLATLKEEFLERAKELGMQNKITLYGFQSREDVMNFYQGTDIFIMLSESQKNGDVEGFGIAMLEANYFNKPVIGSMGCGIEDAVDHGNSGFLVNAKDVYSVRNAVSMIFDEKLLPPFGASKWAQKFDWSNVVELVLNES